VADIPMAPIGVLSRVRLQQPGSFATAWARVEALSLCGIWVTRMLTVFA
jgi:hypothetical protein